MYKTKITEFIDFYLKSYKNIDLKLLINLIFNDINIEYFNSKDFQLFDISYEFDNKLKLKNNFLRFSYFGSDINFLNNFYDFGFSKIIVDKIKNSYKKTLNKKDSFVTYSFVLDNNGIKNIKLYFDVKKLNNYKFSNSNIELNSISFDKNSILEFKKYISVGEKISDNFKFIKRKYNPFDLLFRFSGKNKDLETIKVYYKDFPLNNFESFIKKKPKGLNINNEVGVDYDLKGDIIKYNLYIGLYK